MEIILVALVCIPVCIGIEFLGEWAFYGRSKKHDVEDSSVVRTRFPFRFQLCSLIGLILSCIISVVGFVILALDTASDTTQWVAMLFSALFIISIPLLMTLLAYRNYEVLQEDGILVKRLTKTKLVPFSDMGSYNYRVNQLDIYDHTGRLLFAIEPNRVGKEAILKQIIKHNIPVKQN